MSLPFFTTITGLKHVGKSSTGRYLARRTGYRFLDSDQLLLDEFLGRNDALAEPSISSSRDVYRTVGKNGFMDLELAALERLFSSMHPNEKSADTTSSKTTPLILATGGGLCDNPPAFALVSRMSVTILLDESIETIYRRISRSGLPAFVDPERPYEHFVEIATRRRESYLASADYTIVCEARSTDRIGDAILSLFD